MLKSFYTTAFLSFIFIANAQQKVCVAFYNQENLFDTINDLNKNDEEFLPEGKYKWNTEKYTNKLNHMAQVIASMNEGKGADFIGMCEVESVNALFDLSRNKKLKSMDYKLVFFEGADERGIDNGFLYKSSLVKSVVGKTFEVNPEGLGGDHTRNILMAEITLKNKEKIYFLVNHWPSRREGEKESEFKRKYVASEVRRFCDDIYKTNPKANIIVMGDLNDEPTNLSVIASLGATGSMSQTKNNLLFNTMYALAMDEQGSHKYQGKWGMLDQIIISANLLNEKSKVQFVKESAQVYKQDFMLETAEKYKGNPFRTFVGNKYLNGYSDHLPVMIYLNIGK
jgi:predicted extracellular nuclease